VGGHGHKNFPSRSQGYFGQLMLVRNVSANNGACLLVRRHIFEEINGFDEKFILAFGDVDFCLKIQEKGYLNLWTPHAELYHHESKTRGFDDTLEQKDRFWGEVDYFKHKWAGWMRMVDPYYNPNLSLDHDDYRLNIEIYSPEKMIQTIRKIIAPPGSLRRKIIQRILGKMVF
jgi:hypothetical protein